MGWSDTSEMSFVSSVAGVAPLSESEGEVTGTETTI